MTWDHKTKILKTFEDCDMNFVVSNVIEFYWWEWQINKKNETDI